MANLPRKVVDFLTQTGPVATIHRSIPQTEWVRFRHVQELVVVFPNTLLRRGDTPENTATQDRLCAGLGPRPAVVHYRVEGSYTNEIATLVRLWVSSQVKAYDESWIFLRGVPPRDIVVPYLSRILHGTLHVVLEDPAELSLLGPELQSEVYVQLYPGSRALLRRGKEIHYRLFEWDLELVLPSVKIHRAHLFLNDKTLAQGNAIRTILQTSASTFIKYKDVSIFGGGLVWEGELASVQDVRRVLGVCDGESGRLSNVIQSMVLERFDALLRPGQTFSPLEFESLLSPSRPMTIKSCDRKSMITLAWIKGRHPHLFTLFPLSRKFILSTIVLRTQLNRDLVQHLLCGGYVA